MRTPPSQARNPTWLLHSNQTPCPAKLHPLRLLFHTNGSIYRASFWPSIRVCVARSSHFTASASWSASVQWCWLPRPGALQSACISPPSAYRFLALIGALLNLFALWQVRRLRRRSASAWRRQPLTPGKRRSEALQLVLSVLTLLLLFAEWISHFKHDLRQLVHFIG
jgi:hypothetical protein